MTVLRVPPDLWTKLGRAIGVVGATDVTSVRLSQDVRDEIVAGLEDVVEFLHRVNAAAGPPCKEA